MPKGSGNKDRKSVSKSESGTGRSRMAGLVDRAILAFEDKFRPDKMTIGDYARLLQLQKEMDGDQPKDIRITWVEQRETESSEE